LVAATLCAARLKSVNKNSGLIARNWQIPAVSKRSVIKGHATSASRIQQQRKAFPALESLLGKIFKSYPYLAIARRRKTLPKTALTLQDATRRTAEK
jgi:hypothetical protein